MSCMGIEVKPGGGPGLSGAGPGESLSEPNGLRLEALGSRFVVTCASAHEEVILRQQWSRLGAQTTAALTEIASTARSLGVPMGMPMAAENQPDKGSR